AAAYQIDVSTNRLMPLSCRTTELPVCSVDCLSDHLVLVICDVGIAGVPEVENRGNIDRGLGRPKIARHNLPDIFRHGDAKFTGPAACALLRFAIERNLGAYHHDGIRILHHEIVRLLYSETL